MNDFYFQAYVNGNLQGNTIVLLALVSVTSFLAIAAVLYTKLRSTTKELEKILSTETVTPDGHLKARPLDSRTEQHLIEMIRKTTPVSATGSTAGGPLPVLKRVEPQPKTETESITK